MDFSSNMKLTFSSLAVIAAIVLFILSLAWMFAPGQSLSVWGVEYASSAGLVARRSAAMYAGIAVMLFRARHAEPSLVRSALVNGVVVSCMTLAALGLFELFAGHAQVGILPAVFVEVAISLAFLFVERESRALTSKN
jgi:hypothetical protein